MRFAFLKRFRDKKTLQYQSVEVYPHRQSGSALVKYALAVLRIALGVAVFLALWEGLIRLFAIPSFLLPGPLRVADAFAGQWRFLLHHAWITGFETLIGFACGVAGGVILALAMALSSRLRRVLLPSILITQALPVFAIAPILVLWLGFGLASKIVMAMLVIFFSVTSTFYDGLRRTDPGLLDLAQLYRASRWQQLFHIRIPAALPALTSGIRIAAVFAPIGAIIGEWVGAKGGLAFIMLQSNARMQADVMFAALILLALMVLGLRSATEFLTRRMVPWQSED